MAEFATRSDLKEDIEKRNINIVAYILEYVKLYGETFADDVEFIFEENTSSLITSLSILNLSIVLDNLISNSIKWGATKIHFKFTNISNNTLSLIVSDNGEGLVEKFEKNPEKIFELTVRETAPNGFGGSGIGLFYTRNLLEKMNAKIKFSGNNNTLPGASFEIIFKSL